MTALPYPPKMWKFIDQHFPDGLRHVAEVGSWAGDWVCGLMENLVVDHLFCIDPWAGMRGADRARKVWCERTRPYRDRITAVYMKSLQGVKYVPDDLDLIFVDGNHRMAYEDIEAWWPKLRSGGLMLMHDFNLLSVRRAVLKFFGKYAASRWERLGPVKRMTKTAWAKKDGTEFRRREAIHEEAERLDS